MAERETEREREIKGKRECDKSLHLTPPQQRSNGLSESRRICFYQYLNSCLQIMPQNASLQVINNVSQLNDQLSDRDSTKKIERKRSLWNTKSQIWLRTELVLINNLSIADI